MNEEETRLSMLVPVVRVLNGKHPFLDYLQKNFNVIVVCDSVASFHLHFVGWRSPLFKDVRQCYDWVTVHFKEVYQEKVLSHYGD